MIDQDHPKPKMSAWSRASMLMANSLKQIIAMGPSDHEKVSNAKEYLEEIKLHRGTIPRTARVLGKKDFQEISEKDGYMKLEGTN